MGTARQRSQEWGVLVEQLGQGGEVAGALGPVAYKALKRQRGYGEADSGRAATASSEA